MRGLRDIEEILLKKGVSDSHIKDMKSTLNFNEDPFLFYYKEFENEKPVFKHIPLSKIEAIRRLEFVKRKCLTISRVHCYT